MEQSEFDYFKEGIRKRDEGMARALAHAEDVEEDWSKKALRFVYQYAKTHDEFTGEMIRNASSDLVPRPPHLRSWGAIIVKAVKAGWIRQIGFTHVINPKAHRANAALWRSQL